MIRHEQYDVLTPRLVAQKLKDFFLEDNIQKNYPISFDFKVNLIIFLKIQRFYH